MTLRNIGTGILAAYMAVLVLAAWPDVYRPRAVDRLHRDAFAFLDRFGVRPGMRVFKGTAQPMQELQIARCTVVHGIDARGRRARVYPTTPCPPEGFRWKPVVYEHMIVHWTAWLQNGDYDANLKALGDHFCQSQKHADRNFVAVDLRLDRPMLDYATGWKRLESTELGRVQCR